MDTVIFYTNPMSRGRLAHWMLEEVGAKIDVKLLDFERKEHKDPKYLKLNPMGKVPTIVHRGTVITETGAICAYLADAFPKAGLAPSPTDPARGTYFRWLFFGAGCLEPALIDKMLARPPAEKSGAMGYGTFENTIETLQAALTPGPFVLGEKFSAADLYLAAQMGFGKMVKALDSRPVFDQYIARCTDRPAYQRFMTRTQEWTDTMKSKAAH